MDSTAPSSLGMPCDMFGVFIENQTFFFKKGTLPIPKLFLCYLLATWLMNVPFNVLLLY